MQATSIHHGDVEDTLDRVGRWHAARTDADAALFEAAAHFADLHSGDTLPRSRRVLPGMERSIQIGGTGTPRVAEFSYADLGARMQLGTWSARRYVADALDVRHRLPLIWARVQAREARIGNARVVATRTRHLSVEAAAKVDAAMAAHVDGSLPWGRFLTRLDGKIITADPEVAAAREEEQHRRGQFATRTRSSEAGMAGFYIWSTVGVIARFEATVTFLANALTAFGDTDPDDLRRVKAVALLANPVRAVELLAAHAALRSRHPTTGPEADEPAPSETGALSDLSAQPRPEPDAPFEWPTEEPVADPDPDNELDDGPDANPFHQPDNNPYSDTDSAQRRDQGSDPDGEPDPGLMPDPAPDRDLDPLERIDAFARRVGFTPTRLPAWLTTHASACASCATGTGTGTDTDTDSDVGSDICTERDPADTPTPEPARPEPASVPGFTFDWSRLLPSLTLHLHLSTEDLTKGQGGVVRWEGEGPITHQYLHDHLRPLHTYVIQPVLDPTALAPVDAYEVPDRMRTAIHLRTPADVFPYSSNLTRRVDIDHTEDYNPALAQGPEKHWSTRTGNLGPLGRLSHRTKTFGSWTLRQPFDGIYLWRDPHGHIYLVDHTGTRHVTTPGHPAGPARPFDPDIDIDPTDTIIEIDVS